MDRAYLLRIPKPSRARCGRCGKVVGLVSICEGVSVVVEAEPADPCVASTPICPVFVRHHKCPKPNPNEEHQCQASLRS